MVATGILALILRYFSKSSKSRGGHVVTYRRQDDEPERVPVDDGHQRIAKYKEWFFNLHNLEEHFDLLPRARQELIGLLSEALLSSRHADHQANQQHNILPEEYSSSSLEEFILKEHDDVLEQWQQYVDGRNAGQGPDLFDSRLTAEKWLRQQAPAKYVDGAWLGHVHRLTERTPFALRGITQSAWQVLSEELGDGNLDMNHVFLYRELLHSIGVKLPAADSAEFAFDDHGMGNVAAWKGAVCQLLISLFPEEFLPEMLGFNLHYEQVTLNTLKAARELSELGISGYYFYLHISIDNANSGHAAMSLNTVQRYMEFVKETAGPLDAKEAWNRIKAGYLLSKSSQENGEPESSTANPYLSSQETKIIGILEAKARVSQKIHCPSRVKIGGKPLVDWLSPELWSSKFLQAKLLRDLSRAKPWIRRGDSKNSRLIKEMSWKGKMFGAFSNAEIRYVRRWIDSLSNETTDNHGSMTGSSYWRLVGTSRRDNKDGIHSIVSPDIFAMNNEEISSLRTGSYTEEQSPRIYEWFSRRVKNPAGFNMNIFLSLWFAHPCLQGFVTIPYRTTTPLACHIVRILRIDNGFRPDLSSGAIIDEETPKVDYPSYAPRSLVDLGLEIVHRHGDKHGLPSNPSRIGDIFDAIDGSDREASDAVAFARKMLHLSLRPVANGPTLLGLACAFLGLEEWVAQSPSMLSELGCSTLKDMVNEKRDCLKRCLEELRGDSSQYAQFTIGFELGWAQIDEIFK
ncbi:uncharacterized protein F4822DRAFT_430427 [Hypoxylon trugodes]|uniref:uncharacterized protein n=1 Tax=Hypoxylon trugodes TaxID=326681 RepID=UPI00219E538B|nr:uncharacterized protein F4822DRAFT_430427 [Hypoxylon trugodes]KAI1387681.1 hypothetical protein F4822DRAFT_430427 [Hypoxylon trugodes]